VACRCMERDLNMGGGSPNDVKVACRSESVQNLDYGFLHVCC
jgi:hypothetical protein